MITFWRWFYSNGDQDDWLAVLISNDGGTTWVPVDTVRGTHNQWQEETIHVSSFVLPTNQVKLRLVAADNGYPSIVEAAIDDISTYEGAAVTSAGPGHTPARFGFRNVWPNPARGTVSLALEVPRSGPVEVEVLDLSGRRVRSLHSGAAAAGPLAMRWNGLDDAGHATSAGLYYVRARTNAAEATTRFVRVR